MAITFTTDISTTNILFAYNNNIISFFGNPLKTASKCDITGSGFDVTIYPHPNQSFEFNFIEYVKAFINTRNFIDNVTPDLSVTQLYDGTDGVYFNPNVTIKITYTDATFESVTRNLTFLAIAEDLQTFKRNNLEVSDFFCLSPLLPSTNIKHYVEYWEGYPFDISIYKKNAGDLRITNLANSVFEDYAITDKVTRFFLSDGTTDTSIENIIPLNNGVQELSFNNGKYLVLNYHSNPCGNGIYLKWLNKYGGYSYFLFSDIYETARDTRNIGELQNREKNLVNEISKVTQIGKKSNDLIVLLHEVENGHFDEMMVSLRYLRGKYGLALAKEKKN